MVDNPPDEELRRILGDPKTVAVVGLSDKPDRYSYTVAGYLQHFGHRIIPVNPFVEEVLGEKSYASLEEIPDEIDVVDVFRGSRHAPGIVESAIKIGAPVVWMQEGIVHEEAAQRGREAGLTVVMDRCMKKEHHRLFADHSHEH
ncbi:MAG: CoA-binding protein [Anaerolineae bacterium]